jgi:hypothetical protein
MSAARDLVKSASPSANAHEEAFPFVGGKMQHFPEGSHAFS